MVLKKFISFLKYSHKWIAASIAAGLTAGLVAAFFFNPYVVTYRIKNIGGFFEIESLKSAKLQILSLTEELITQAIGSERARLVSQMLSKPDWVETNIVPVFGVTKADIRDLVDTGLTSNSRVYDDLTFVNFRNSAKDPALALDDLRVVASLILNIAKRNQLSSWLDSNKTNHEKILYEVGQQIPDIILLLVSNRERLKLVKNYIGSNSNASKNTQFNLSMNQGQGAVNNNLGLPVTNGDLTVFMPPEIQLSGLEIHQSYLDQKLNQFRFKQEVFEYLLDRTSEGQKFINNLDPGSVIGEPDLPEGFWRQGKISKLLNEEQGWRLEYLENILRRLEQEQKNIHLGYQAILKQSQMVEQHRKFSRLLAIAAGLVVGLMVPLIVFVMNQMNDEEKMDSEKA